MAAAIDSSKSGKTYSRAEVAKHNKEGDLWTIIDAKVYDLSKFADLHPGGLYALLQSNVAGKDSTEAFFGLHRSEVLQKYKRLEIGTVENEKSKVILPKAGELSKVPYAEPMWLSRGYHSPYFDDSHHKLQQWMRKFTDEVVREEAMEHEESGERPSLEFIEKCGSEGVLHMRMGPGKHLHGMTLPGGIKGESFTYLHEMIVTQELVRAGGRGFSDGFNGGMVIGLPPIMNFASDEVKREVMPDVLAGKKFICLAISEAYAGSDVQGLMTVATKNADGHSWTINGSKKWITNGVFSDWFIVGARTGKALSVFLVPRCEGVETKIIKTSYSTAAGTAYVSFDGVVVPNKYLLGKENRGVQVILSNFNHERWVMCCGSIRASRSIYEETMKWCTQRKAFGKPLIAQAVVRYKLAGVLAKVESLQAWLEAVTYQMTKMSYAEQSDLLAGQIALLKMHATRSFSEIVEACVQLWGGRALTKSGMGKHIENASRNHRFDAILGGAEDVLADLAVRRAVAKMPLAVL